MKETTLESILMGVLAVLFLAAVVVQARQRHWPNVVAYGLLVLVTSYLMVMTASGVLFVGPGGRGGVSIP